MTQNQYNKLKAIAERLNTDFLNLGVSTDFRYIKDTWSNAVYYNKIQKQMEGGETVRILNVKDERTNELNNFHIVAKHNFTRMEYFLICILYDNYATLQTIKKALKEFKF
jgi:hypothetical protein